jgi:tetrahydromethanopterin S-methyltransferase subunit C
MLPAVVFSTIGHLQLSGPAWNTYFGYGLGAIIGLLGGLIALVIGNWAERKGLNWLQYFLIATFASQVVSLIIIAVTPLMLTRVKRPTNSIGFPLQQP